MTFPYQKLGLRSLLMHREAVRMIRADPSLASKALATLERRRVLDGKLGPYREKYRNAWAQIIAEQDWGKALDESERGCDLRKFSPLPCLLPNDVRIEIIKEISALQL